MNKTTKARGIQIRKQMYDAIVSYTQEHLYPPSVREIADMVGLKSSSTVHGHLQRLADAGLIEIDQYQPRCIKLVGYQLVKVDKK